MKDLFDMCFGSTQYGSGIMKTQPKSLYITQISIDIIRAIQQQQKTPARMSVY